MLKKGLFKHTSFVAYKYSKNQALFVLYNINITFKGYMRSAERKTKTATDKTMHKSNLKFKKNQLLQLHKLTF